MGKVIKSLGSKSAVIIFILVLGAWPVGGLAKTSHDSGSQKHQEEKTSHAGVAKTPEAKTSYARGRKTFKTR